MKLYAWALDKLLRDESKKNVLTDEIIFEVASNGTRLIETIINNRTYSSKCFALILKGVAYRITKCSILFKQALLVQQLKLIEMVIRKAIFRYWH